MDRGGQCYALIEKTLLKILSQLTFVPNPEASDNSFRLNDRVGLWPANGPPSVGTAPSEWLRQPYLCLHLLLLESAAAEAWFGSSGSFGLGSTTNGPSASMAR